MKAQAFSALLAAGSTLVSSAALPRNDASGTAASVSLSGTEEIVAKCQNPQKRLEWRQLTPEDQKGYLDAVLCLTTKPSRIGLSSTLYDDFAHVHFELSSFIHGGPPFLPWHRYFTKVYEDALRDCGYTGPGTYWDWTQDTAGFLTSAVMDDTLGFGGNGSPNRTEPSPGSEPNRRLPCVSSGPFKDLRPQYLATSPSEIDSQGHCMFRQLAEVSEPQAFEQMVPSFSPSGVARVLAAQNWTTFHSDLEGGPHGVIHASLAGEMNPTTSPNEPLFFLHHAKVDLIWWTWQQQNDTRLSEYTGEALHYQEDGRRAVRLDDTLSMMGLADDLKVMDVMDTRSEKLCFVY